MSTADKSALTVQVSEAHDKLTYMADRPNHMHHLSGDDAQAIRFILQAYQSQLGQLVRTQPGGRLSGILPCGHPVGSIDVDDHVPYCLECWNEADPRPTPRMDIVLTVLKERRKQETEKGYDAEHDDGHTEGEIAHAAACYMAGGELVIPESNTEVWPFEGDADRIIAAKDRERQLVIAMALAMAEIERLRRL